MALEIIATGGGAATADSISIPLTDLSGQGATAAEMTNDASGIGQAVFSFLKTLAAYDLSNVLGFNITAGTESTAGQGRLNRPFTITHQIYNDQSQNTANVVPLPSTGANSGIGGVALTDIFPNAVKVAATDAVANEALLIPTADLTPYKAAVTHAAVNITAGNDNRDLLTAIMQMFSNDLTLRSASEASAFVGRTVGSPTTLIVPTAYTQSTDPISDIDAADITSGKVWLNSQSFSLTIQTVEDSTTETFKVNVVTA